MVEVLVRVCLDLGLKNNFLYFMQSIPKSNGVFYALLVKGKKKGKVCELVATLLF